MGSFLVARNYFVQLLTHPVCAFEKDIVLVLLDGVLPDIPDPRTLVTDTLRQLPIAPG